MPGYSKLGIADGMLPDIDCPPLAAALDMYMMSSFSAKERSEAERRGILGNCESRGAEAGKGSLCCQGVEVNAMNIFNDYRARYIKRIYLQCIQSGLFRGVC